MVLSEFESKQLLRRYGIPTVEEALARDPEEAAACAAKLGYPVALKLCAAGLAHKTERNLVRLGLATDLQLRAAAVDLLGRRRADETDAALLVQRMISGRRELILGLIRDRQFGPCVMVGLGGILAEAIDSVAFRVAPVTLTDGFEMIDDLGAGRLLGEFRGEPAANREALAGALVALGRIGLDDPAILSIDINPMIVSGARPVAVDALVERGGEP